MAENKAPKPKPMSETEVLQRLTEATGLVKKEVESVLSALETLIKDQLGKKGPGVFQVPGLIKLELQRLAATKEAVKPNPFKPGEMMTVAAKPARTKVKARVLKGLKDIK